MRTSLAYIGTAAEAALDRESGDPTVPAAAKSRAKAARLKVIGGLAVDDVAAGDKELEQGRQSRLDRIERYQWDRARLEESLERVELTPLAILPTAAWNRICFEADLYRFAPNSEGKVAASNEKLWQLYVERVPASERLVRWSNYCTISAWVLIVGTFVGAGLLRGSWGAFWGYGLLSIIPIIVLACIVHAVGKKRMFAKVTRDYLARQLAFEKSPATEQCRALFPDKTSPKDSKMTIAITLPKPPEDVAAILLKARRLDLQVAVTPEAIGFTKSFHQMFLDEEARKRKEQALIAEEARRRFLEQQEEARRAAILADPIVYHEHGTAVAILAQFGDFPIEQSVVDMVMNSEQLL